MQKILVVEDDKCIRENLDELLSLSGFQALAAVDGVDALEKAKSFIPDLVISDIMMPNMDGYEFYKSFNKLYGIYNIPFVFLTAKSESYDIRKGMNLGADDYITKPYRAEVLLETINARIAKSKSQRKLFEKITSNIALYVPHELRTPLVSILGISQIILEDFDNLNKQEILAFVDHIKLSGNRLHKRIEKFLTLVEVDLVTADRYFENLINISELKGIEELVNNISFTENVKISIPALPNLKIKIADHFLTVILYELIENAIKFRVEHTEIKIQHKVEDEKFYLSIMNISKENIPNMVEHQLIDFMQFDKKLNQQRGNGLGLSIIKRVAKLYGLNFNITKSSDNQVIATIIFSIYQN